MNVASVRKLCASFPGVTEKDTGEPSNVLVFHVGNKPFAYFKTSEPERWRFSFRTSPERFVELTDQPGIKPARYMHRFHWVTVVKTAAMNPDYLRELIAWSYERAFAGLPKKVQKQIKVVAGA